MTDSFWDKVLSDSRIQRSQILYCDVQKQTRYQCSESSISFEHHQINNRNKKGKNNHTFISTHVHWGRWLQRTASVKWQMRCSLLETSNNCCSRTDLFFFTEYEFLSARPKSPPRVFLCIGILPSEKHSHFAWQFYAAWIKAVSGENGQIRTVIKHEMEKDIRAVRESQESLRHEDFGGGGG